LAIVILLSSSLRTGITGRPQGWFRQKSGGSGKKINEIKKKRGTFFVASESEAVLGGQGRRICGGQLDRAHRPEGANQVEEQNRNCQLV
jgi:hypothetical protein